MPPSTLLLPAPDIQLSPYTGLTRDHWCSYADFLLRSAHRYATDNHANIHLPGAGSAYGPRSDSLEAFARTFLMASFRMAGDPREHGLARRLVRPGAGCRDQSRHRRTAGLLPESWGRPRWKPPRSRWALP